VLNQEGDAMEDMYGGETKSSDKKVKLELEKKSLVVLESIENLKQELLTDRNVCEKIL